MSHLLQTIDTFLAEKIVAALILTAFVTVIAYLHSPRIKMLVFSMPIPFTCAYLQSHLPINTTHILGMVLTMLYHWIVYFMAKRWKLPLGLGIVSGVVFYVSMAFFIGTAGITQPLREMPVPWAVGIVVLFCSVVSWLYHPAHEPGHRSNTPWWIKSPLILTITLIIFSLTQMLRGAVTTFPYAGTFASYEMRHSLRTLAGQYVVNNFSFLLMFLTIWWMEQHHMPQPWPLLAGWAMLIVSLGIIFHFGFGRPPKVEEAEQVSVGK